MTRSKVQDKSRPIRSNYGSARRSVARQARSDLAIQSSLQATRETPRQRLQAPLLLRNQQIPTLQLPYQWRDNSVRPFADQMVHRHAMAFTPPLSFALTFSWLAWSAALTNDLCQLRIPFAHKQETLRHVIEDFLLRPIAAKALANNFRPIPAPARARPIIHGSHVLGDQHDTLAAPLRSNRRFNHPFVDPRH